LALEQLRLNQNKIADLEPLIKNPGIGANDKIDLTGNPLNAQSINEYMPQLRSRGVQIDW
jgi:hypothetical protein